MEISDLQQYFDMIVRNKSRLEDFAAVTVAKSKTLDDARDFLAHQISLREGKLFYPFILVDDYTNEGIGYMGIKEIDWSIPKAEIGLFTDEKYAGKGVTTKALSSLADYCFSNWVFRKILLRINRRNIAACKMAEKCGFEIEGEIRNDYITTSGEIVDMLYYGKIA